MSVSYRKSDTYWMRWILVPLLYVTTPFAVPVLTVGWLLDHWPRSSLPRCLRRPATVIGCLTLVCAILPLAFQSLYEDFVYMEPNDGA